MNKHISVSQIKLFIKSQQQRAGKYILWIEDDWVYESLILGGLFHESVEKWLDPSKVLELHNELEDEAMVMSIRTKLHTLQENFSHYDDSGIIERERQFSCTLWEYNWEPMTLIWYIDAIRSDGTIIDYKTVSNFTVVWDDRIPMRGGMSIYDSYELQAWLYMYATWYKRAEFVEILKKSYKKYTPKDSHQVISFTWSDELHQKMSEKYYPIIENMYIMHSKFKHINS